MGPPPPTIYLTEGSFSPSDTEIIAAYIAQPSLFLGPVLMSAVLDNVLMGLVIAQTWNYYSYYWKENARFKILVGLLFIIGLAQSSAVAYMLFDNYGTRFGDWEHLETYIGLTNFRIVGVLENLAGTMSQIFFLERAVTLVRLKLRPAGWVLLAFCVPSILAGLSLGLAGVIVGFASSESEVSYALIVSLVTAWKAVTIATDVVLTGTILTCLYINRTGRHTTDSLLGALSRGVIEAQTLPLLAAILFIIALAIDPVGNFSCIPAYMEGKLAILSVIHVLNSRTRIRNRPFVQSTGNLNEFSADGEKITPSANGRTERTERSRTEKTRIDKNGVVVVVASAAPTASVLHELDMMAFDRVMSTDPSKGGKKRESGIAADGLSLESDLSGDEEGEERRDAWDDDVGSSSGKGS